MRMMLSVLKQKPDIRYSRSISISMLSLMISISAAEITPSVSDFDSAVGEAQTQILMQWTSLISKQRQPQVKDWSVPPEWAPIKSRLAQIPVKNASLIYPSAKVFKLLGEPSPECLEFCHSILGSEDKVLRAKCVDALQLLNAVKGSDEKSIDLVIAAVANPECSSIALEQLGTNFNSNQKVKAAFLAWLNSENPSLREAAYKYLPNFPLSPMDAANIIGGLTQLLVGRPSVESTALATRFCSSMQAHPERFLRCLNEEKTLALLPVLRASDRKAAVCACQILSIAASVMPGVVPDLLVESFATATGPESAILAVTGFLRVDKQDKSASENLARLLRGKSPEACSGLLSRYARLGGDAKALMDEQRGPKRPEWRVDGTYWSTFLGCKSGYIHPPEKWRELWTTTFAEAHEALLPLLTAYPDSPEAIWMIEQSVGTPKLAAGLIESLWAIRDHSKSFSSAKGLREWLSTQLDSKSETIASMAAGLLFHCYGEKQQSLNLLQSINQKHPAAFVKWSVILDTAIEVDPANVILDRFREAIAPTKSSDLRSDRQWWLWLLDCRCGKSVTAPPIESLMAALQTVDNERQPWIDSLIMAGPKIYPWIDDLRNPAVFMVGSTRSMSMVMQYLGALDRLELEKSKAK